MRKKEKKIRQQIHTAFGKPKIEGFDFDAIRRYTDRNHKKSFQTLSEKLCDDLNLNDLFIYVDRTSSRVGQQCLFESLRTIPPDRKRIDVLEKWIAEFQKHEKLRMDFQYQLHSLNDEETYYLCDLFQSEKIKPPKWLPAAYVLSLTNLLAIILIFRTPIFLLVSMFITIVNVVMYYLNKKNVNTYLNSMPQVHNLDRTVRIFLSVGFIKDSDEIAKASVRALHLISRKMNFFRLNEISLGIDPFAILYNLIELIKIIFILDPIFLFRVLHRIETHEKELHDAFAFVGLVDQAVSLTSLRSGLPYYCPLEPIRDIKDMHFSDIYIPIIENCVANSLNANGKSVLITGSNMSGKTTFIRTVGINALMGLTLNTCFARTFAMPKLHLYSAILMNDDLMNDKSFYLEEVQTIKEMIEVSHKSGPNLFLLDEIYKGTNTVERVSGGKAVLSWLNHGDNLVFISTHDIELTELLKNEYALYHFSEQVENQTISFDFKIKKGKMITRNAIKILEVNGYPPELIAEARQLSFEMDKQRPRFDD